MKRFITTIAVSLIVVMGMVAPVSALNDGFDTAHELFFGQAQYTSHPIGGDRWYKARLEAGRSYCVMVWAATNDTDNVATSLSSTVYRNDGATEATTQWDTNIEPRPVDNGEQTKIIPDVTETHRIRIRNNAAAGAAYNVWTMILETTLFSPWYFINPTTGYDGYIEIRNNTSSTLEVRVRAYDPAGGVAGETVLSLPANGNNVVPVTSMGVVADYGSVQIAHNGPPGAISANITTLSSITGLSFDSPFTPRMSWSTFALY